MVFMFLLVGTYINPNFHIFNLTWFAVASLVQEADLDLC